MRIPGKKTLQRIVRPIVTAFRPGGLILGYHRIAEVSWDPLGICIRPSNFQQQLEALVELCTPVSLQTLVASLREGRNVQDMVALTFDDGYRDFIDNAQPELDRLGIPATVFIATGFSGQTYWWDEIARYFRPDKQTSSELTLRWDDHSTVCVYSDLTSERGAARATQDICRELSMRSEVERAFIMEQLRHFAAIPCDPKTLPGTMSVNELRKLAELPNIEIGSHTVTHPVLASLTVAQQRQEIELSKRHLQDATGSQNVPGLSYPNGSCSAQICRQVAEAGYEYACASQQDVVRKGMDLYRLPRLWVPDADHRKFRAWLSSWHGVRIKSRSSRHSG